MATYRLMDGSSGRPGNGPSAATSYQGDYLAGTVFQVTAGNFWFEGFWWWVCNSGQQTGPQSFGLWQVDNTSAGLLIVGTTVTSGTLTAGAWNYIPLSTPIPLSPGIPYVAGTGYISTSGFPKTDSQFGSGDTYSAGITNGPLTAYSSTSGSAPAPNKWVDQGLFGTAYSDPTENMPYEATSQATSGSTSRSRTRPRPVRRTGSGRASPIRQAVYKTAPSTSRLRQSSASARTAR